MGSKISVTPYSKGMLQAGSIPHKGLFSSAEAVQHGLPAELLQFAQGTDFDKYRLFMWSYDHAGSGGDKPAVKMNVEGDKVHFELWLEKRGLTRDLRRTSHHFAARISKTSAAKHVVVDGLQSQGPHQFSLE